MYISLVTLADGSAGYGIFHDDNTPYTVNGVHLCYPDGSLSGAIRACDILRGQLNSDNPF